MPLCLVEDFENEILSLDFLDEFDPSASLDAGKAGIFVFYQNDVDGIAAMFILEHHARFRNGLKLANLPVSTESDVYTFIKKSLSIQSAYPDLKPDYYLRVVLLGIYGWNIQLLYAIKIHFQQLLPQELKNDLKIAIVSVMRPISFFHVPHDGEWYFFVQNEEEMAIEEQEYDEMSGIYHCNSIASIMEQISKATHEANQAAIIYAASVGILSKAEHSSGIHLNVNARITELFQKTFLLDGGPFTSYDSEKSLLPLIMFTSVEEALRISPSVLVYDPRRTPETLADLRIHCNLKPDEFTAEFCNLDLKRQSLVLRLLKSRINLYKDKPQLCWLRRATTVPAIDVIYIMMAILAGWTTKDNTSTQAHSPIIASDFLYNTLVDRMFQESFYDRSILSQLKKKTVHFISKLYDLMSRALIGIKTSGSDSVIITTLYPQFNIRHSDHLRFLGFLLSSTQARATKKDSLRCLIFIKNPGFDGFICYGYSPDVRVEFPDLWPLVFTSVSQDDPNYIYDVLNPNILHIRGNEVDSAKGIIVERLRIALEAKHVMEDEEEEDDD